MFPADRTGQGIECVIEWYASTLPLGLGECPACAGTVRAVTVTIMAIVDDGRGPHTAHKLAQIVVCSDCGEEYRIEE